MLLLNLNIVSTASNPKLFTQERSAKKIKNNRTENNNFKNTVVRFLKA